MNPTHRKLAGLTTLALAVASSAVLGVAPASATGSACFYEGYGHGDVYRCTSADNWSYHDHDSSSDYFNNGTLLQDRISSIDVSYDTKLMMWTNHHYTGESYSIYGDDDGDMEEPDLRWAGKDNVFSSHFFW